MSPRAACRLELLGFAPVYDYVAGKVEWMAAGLPTVRADSSVQRALAAADRDPLTCGLETRLRMLPEGRTVIVVDENRVVLGRVSAERPGYGGRTAEEVMRPGPATVRAHEPLVALLERMRRRGAAEMLVTTPEGVLLGVVRAGSD